MKKEQEELTIWGKIELFFRDVFMMPSRDGQRRFIKNIFTGKNQWTRGSEPFITTKEEITYTPPKEDSPRENLENSNFSKVILYEPFHGSRWTFDFPEIANYTITNLKAYGNELMCIEIFMIINNELTDTLEKFYKMAINGNGDLYKHALLKLFDPAGVVIDSYVYRNVKIEEVEMLEKLSYDTDEVLTAKITFSHEVRKRVESPEDLAENIFEEEELYEMTGEDMDKMDEERYGKFCTKFINDVIDYTNSSSEASPTELIIDTTLENEPIVKTRKKRGPYKKRVQKDKKIAKKIVVKTKKAPLIKPKKKR